MLCFALLLLVARIFRTGHFSFVFLLWNFFLAWLPVWFARVMQHKSGLSRKMILLSAILFLPNAPYLSTDLFHLSKNLVAPLWLDTILILNFAIMGLICFVQATVLILQELKRMTGSDVIYYICKSGLLLASGYGIYLGRYLRFNSWDLVLNPFGLLQGICDSWFPPGYWRETMAISLTFAVFLYLILNIYEHHFFRTPAGKTSLPE